MTRVRDLDVDHPTALYRGGEGSGVQRRSRELAVAYVLGLQGSASGPPRCRRRPNTSRRSPTGWGVRACRLRLQLRGRGPAVYVEGVDAAALEPYATVVTDPAAAEVALIRLKTPYEPRPGGFESHFHAGSLEFGADEVRRLEGLFATVPTVVDLYLERPAIVPEVAAGAAALLVNYGSSTQAFTDVIFGSAAPQGRLPFDLPSSTRAVEDSRTDVPFDTADPLFRFGEGLSYRG